MSYRVLNDLARKATVAVTRRGSLIALGGAALATGLGGSNGSAAKNNDKKKAKKAKKKFKKQCNQQRELCRSILLDTNPAITICCNSCFSGDLVACAVQAAI